MYCFLYQLPVALEAVKKVKTEKEIAHKMKLYYDKYGNKGVVFYDWVSTNGLRPIQFSIRITLIFIYLPLVEKVLDIYLPLFPYFLY